MPSMDSDLGKAFSKQPFATSYSTRHAIDCCMEHGFLPFIMSHLSDRLGRSASRGSSFFLSLIYRLGHAGLSLDDGEEPSFLFLETFTRVQNALCWMWRSGTGPDLDLVPSILR